MMKLPAAVLLATGLAIGGALSGSAMSQTAGEYAGHHAAADAAAASYLTDGEVRKVDKASGTVAIKHGAIKNLDMPAMTMVFQAKDNSLLDKVKAGDKIRFRAESENGKLLVTDIQNVK
jgi:Cu(I)/Ag(I) efflux system periplasmic protein CusF